MTTGSSKTEFGGAVVQSVRIPACHAGGRGFESRPFRHLLKVKPAKSISGLNSRKFRGVAQLVEHRSPKPGVASSSLSAPAIYNPLPRQRIFFVRYFPSPEFPGILRPRRRALFQYVCLQYFADLYLFIAVL